MAIYTLTNPSMRDAVAVMDTLLRLAAISYQLCASSYAIEVTNKQRFII